MKFEEHLKNVADIPAPAAVSLDEVLKSSGEFMKNIAKFSCTTPLNCNLQKQGKSEELLKSNINSAYPIVHEKVLHLMCNFIEFKRNHGSDLEKNLYKEMDLVQFVDRLLMKRPLQFMCSYDSYILRNRRRGSGDFDLIGTQLQRSLLTLDDYISYDEMKISALLSTSSWSLFINDGDRFNRGIPGKEDSFEEQGVIVGLVGTRFEVAGRMEWQEIVVTRTQNVEDNGYGDKAAKHKLTHIFAKFYEQPHLPDYETVSKADENFIHVSESGYFNCDIYKRRIQISAETLLIEANHRARAVNKKAYVHMVGIGLGVWSFIQDGFQQIELFLEGFADCFRSIGDALTEVSDVHFSWFRLTSCGGVSDNEIFPGTNIKIHFSRRAPQEKLREEHEGKVSVSCWAWDSNAFPGNEYWGGSLTGSGDPAAACNSQIVELHNPYINPKMRGSNLHVASKEHGIVPLQTYAQLLT